MITFISCPKPFRGKIAVLQENAIGSWRSGHPDCQIILIGEEEGIQEIANKYDCLTIPHVKTTKYGTPLVNDIFNKSIGLAKFSRFCL